MVAALYCCRYFMCILLGAILYTGGGLSDTCGIFHVIVSVCVCVCVCLCVCLCVCVFVCVCVCQSLRCS